MDSSLTIEKVSEEEIISLKNEKKNYLFTEEKKKEKKDREEDFIENHQPSIFPQKWKSKHFLPIADNIISLLLIGPLVIGHWRGVWGLMDYYNLPLSEWLCLLLGSTLHCIFACLRPVLHRIFAEHWRLANPIGRAGIVGGVTSTLVGILLVLKSSRNLLAPPFIIVVDIPHCVFNFPTRYRAMSIETTTLDTQDWRMVELRSGSGMTATLDRPTSSRFHYRLLVILDAIFSAFVAAPAVVGYWRGTWGLSDRYIFPNNQKLSNLSSIVIGYGGLLLFNILQGYFNDIFHPDKHRLFYYIGSRIYTAIFGFCCVNAWRGGWQALDIYTEHASSTVICTTIVAIVALVFMKAVKNISAPPFSLSLDSHPGYFEVPTMFRVDNSRDCTLYLLDCIFSVGVVGTLVVFVWRGVWVLLEKHLFPGNHEYSALGSMIIGYIIVALTFCLQPIMRYVCSRLQGLPRLLTADAFLLLSFLGTVNVWRGIWGLLDVWLLPEKPELSCWITHIGCFIFLGLLNCSNSILVRGVYIDAEEEEGKCVVFPCHYLRLFFKIEREKKEARRRNHLSRDYVPSEHKDAENGALLNCTSVATIIPANPECLVLK